MIPIIMNTNFIKLGMIDDYISFIWTDRYYTVGDFELCVSINNTTISLLQKDYYVMREDDDNIGIIEKIHFSKTEDGNSMMIVTGRFLASILGRRIIATMTQINNLTIPAAINKLITENVINPTIAARKIDNFTFVDDTNITTRIRVQYTGKNLLETIKSICETYSLGFKVIFENNGFAFHLYEGVDRSYNQNINPYIVFSSNYDNLESSEYEEDYQNIVTDVLVAGEGEGLDRKAVWASSAANSGLNRYELYKDARNTSTNDGAISDENYLAQLEGEGLESITTLTQAFIGNVYFEGYRYKTDVNIGDVCTIQNTDWGIHINTRILEIIESVDESGKYSIIPSFGCQN